MLVNKKRFLLSACLLITGSFIHAQTELMAWGNITGIRVDGQLMEFETSIRVVEKGWKHEDATGKERRTTHFERKGNSQVVQSAIGGYEFTEVVADKEKGSAAVKVHIKSIKDSLEGIFYCVDLPAKYFDNASLRFTKGTRSKLNPANISSPIRIKAKGFSAVTAIRNFEMQFDSDRFLYIKKDNTTGSLLVYISLAPSVLPVGEEYMSLFTLKASGVIDTSTVHISMDRTNPGNRFDGMGGNFRMQNMQLDPPVIQYCLDNMDVRWGRVEMPLHIWHPEENTDPVDAANKGNLNPHVCHSMEMAQKLAARNIPVIISDWSAPAWAIMGDPRDAYRYRSKGIYGYQLNPEKMEKILKSIGDYLVYLKQHYGVEPVMFSFNESDLGIDVRHTGLEHAEFIKSLGAYFDSRGIKTKLLLGDNSDATTFDFILPAMKDFAAHKYIGAISFHSWRGCDDATLKKWADAAKLMNVPLIIAEGSTDAAAWNYPQIFFEQPFALYEINLYMRLCNICQPLSILQWQLTADYSALAGNGIFGTTGPLQPTRRFWNLKQLANTPEGSFSLPISADNASVNCAAFGNLAKDLYTIHIVNNGALRKAVISGFPAEIHKVAVFVTNEEKAMEKTEECDVINGDVVLDLMPASFITLTGYPVIQ